MKKTQPKKRIKKVNTLFENMNQSLGFPQKLGNNPAD